MSSSLTLEGNIVLGPQGVCEGGGPQGVLNMPFSIGACSCVPAPISGSYMKTLAAATFVTLPGIGANDAMTKCKFLFVRTNASLSLRLTQFGGTAQTLDVNGLCILQFPSDKALVLLEALGTATIEYVAVGDS